MGFQTSQSGGPPGLPHAHLQELSPNRAYITLGEASLASLGRSQFRAWGGGTQSQPIKGAAYGKNPISHIIRVPGIQRKGHQSKR